MINNNFYLNITQKRKKEKYEEKKKWIVCMYTCEGKNPHTTFINIIAYLTHIKQH